MKQCSDGFQDSMSLKGVQERFDNPSRRDRLGYIVEGLGERLDLSELKIDQAKDLIEDLDMLSLEKGSRDGIDDVVLGGAIIHVVSRQMPKTPRWTKLVAEECRSFAKSEGRPSNALSNTSYSSKSKNHGVRDHWKQDLNSFVKQIKDQDFEYRSISAVDYMYHLNRVKELDSSLAAECIRKIAFLENNPEYQSKDRVILAGAVLNVVCEGYGKEIDLDEFAAELCVNKYSLEEYSEELRNEI